MTETATTYNDAILLESNDRRMQRVLEAARHAATTDAVILLSGESGSGKSVLARQIHRWSLRAHRSFVALNCAMLSERFLESELFGQKHPVIASTAKTESEQLEAEIGGTIFLEEISDMRPELQTKFLRFVEEQSSEGEAGEQTICLDKRVIVASNRDLASEVAAKRFRQDLYYRLGVIALEIPPLRARSSDILPLAMQILSAANTERRRPTLRFSPEALSALVDCRWPGNIRELRNVIERAVVLCPGNVISAEYLPEVVYSHQSSSTTGGSGSASLDDVQREHIIRVMATSRTLEDAANRLGIDVSTLWRRRKRYGIEVVIDASKH